MVDEKAKSTMLRKEHANECRNCKVLPSEAITTQHRIVIADLVVKKTRQRRAAGRKRIRWWKLKDEESKEKYRRELVERLSNIDEATTENVEQWWEEIAEQIMKCGEELCGRSTGKKKAGLESWWWNDETESAVKEKKERLDIWKRTGEENDKVEYKTAKGKANRRVARVKAEAIEGLYDQLETVEGQQEIYRIAAARDQSGKDICQIRNVKSASGEVLMKARSDGANTLTC